MPINQYNELGYEEGLWETYHSNDTNCIILRRFFKNGKLDGIYEAYDAKGQLKYKGFFKNGSLKGYRKMYWKDSYLTSFTII